MHSQLRFAAATVVTGSVVFILGTSSFASCAGLPSAPRILPIPEKAGPSALMRMSVNLLVPPATASERSGA